MMDADSFDQRKAAALKAIINACEYDRSPKGSVDEPIRELVDAINQSRDFATTSSCSGRISLFHTSGSDVTVKGTGKWLLALHRPLVNENELRNALCEGLDAESKDAANSITLFKHEPFVLHVMCRTVECAQSVLKIAMDCGFRESGLSVGGRKIMVGIRTTSNSLESPVAKEGKIICTDDYLVFLAEEANKRFRENARRTKHFQEALMNFLEQFKQQKGQTNMDMKIEPSWIEVTSSVPIKRWGHSSTALDGDNVLVFGGWGEVYSSTQPGQDKQQQHAHLSHTLLFNLVQNAFTPISGEEPDARVYHTTVGLPNRSCALFGGRRSPLSPMNDWWTFSLDKMAWTKLKVVDNSPSARWRHAACFIEKTIYVYGGRNSETTFSDLWEVHIDGDQVKAREVKSTGSSPGPRFSHSMVATSNKLILHGGLHAFDAASGPKDFHIFDVVAKTWSNIVVDGIHWGFSQCLVPLNTDAERVLLLGGIGDSYSRAKLRGTEAIELNTSTFSVRAFQIKQEDSMLMAQNSVVSLHDGTTILSFGGGATCFAFGSVFSSSAYIAWAKPAVSQISTLPQDDAMLLFWACSKTEAVIVKGELSLAGALDKSRKVLTEEGTILFPIKDANVKVSAGSPAKRSQINSKPSSAPKASISKEEVLSAALDGARCKVDRIDDVLLIHSREFTLDRARKVEPEKWESILAAYPGAKRIVWGAEVDLGPMRESRSILVYCARDVLPNNCWVTVKENKVKFSFDMLRCMYSKGNVAEKARFAGLIQPGERVLDLFAGIGYFTVPALALSNNVKRLYASEWNPHSIRALRFNLKQNGVEERCVVYPGDCRLVKLPSDELANRVSLGLIPTSRVGFEPAIKNLCEKGGWLHVHWNVAEDGIEQLRLELVEELTNLARNLRGSDWIASCEHVQRVKSFAPRVLHVVLDVRCGPSHAINRLTSNQTPVDVESAVIRSKEEEESPVREHWNAIRQAADGILCARGRELSSTEFRSVAADAELLFRRIRQRAEKE